MIARWWDRLLDFCDLLSRVGLILAAAFLVFCIVTTWYVVVVQGALGVGAGLDLRHLKPAEEQSV